jgi:hypothetical protein
MPQQRDPRRRPDWRLQRHRSVGAHQPAEASTAVAPCRATARRLPWPKTTSRDGEARLLAIPVDVADADSITAAAEQPAPAPVWPRGLRREPIHVRHPGEIAVIAVGTMNGCRGGVAAWSLTYRLNWEPDAASWRSSNIVRAGACVKGEIPMSGGGEIGTA